MTLESNVAASEKFESSQNEVVANLCTKEDAAQDEEQLQEKTIKERAVHNHYMDNKEL